MEYKLKNLIAESTYVDKDTNLPLDVIAEHVKCRPVGFNKQVITTGGRATEIVETEKLHQTPANPRDTQLMSRMGFETSPRHHARSTISLNSEDIKVYKLKPVV